MGFADLPHWVIKVITIIILFLLSMIFGAIPLKLSRDESTRGGTTSMRNLLISLSNCFAGGVFFSTVILDLFPMVKAKMTNALTVVDIETDFPLGDFIIGCGFILMLILEQVVHSCCSNNLLNHGGHSHNQKDQVFDYDEATHLITDDINDLPDNDFTEVEVVKNQNLKKSVSVGPTEILHGNSMNNSEESVSNEELDVDRRSHTNKSVSSYETFYSEFGTHHRIKRMHRTKSLASMHSLTNSNFRAYVLVFAISLHSLFEGLAVGLMTQTQVILQVFLALVIHKSIIAFSIGVQLVDADLSSSAVLICISIFAIMAPIGIALGLCVLNTFNSVIKVWFSGVLQGIATGSFLYVTFFEVLPHELNISDEKKPLKIFFVMIGYTVITAVCYYENSFHKLSPVDPHPTLDPSLVW